VLGRQLKKKAATKSPQGYSTDEHEPLKGVLKKGDHVQILSQGRRREHGQGLLDTLQSLWDALNVPPDDLDRDFFGRLLSGPSSLHQASHDRVPAMPLPKSLCWFPAPCPAAELPPDSISGPPSSTEIHENPYL